MNKRQIHSLHFKTLPSTHLFVKEQIGKFDPLMLTCVVAQEQTAGRGQWGRPFVSQKGNLYLTVYFTVKQGDAPHLSQVLSLSCATLLQEEGVPCQIKWPNDLMLNAKKCGGVLCETTPLNGRLSVVLSIGLNMNMSQEMLRTIDQPATSLFMETHKLWDVTSFLEKLIPQFMSDLEELEELGFSSLLERYTALLKFARSTICVKEGSHIVEGVFHSIDVDGHLVLQTNQGLVRCVTGQVLQ